MWVLRSRGALGTWPGCTHLQGGPDGPCPWPGGLRGTSQCPRGWTGQGSGPPRSVRGHRKELLVLDPWSLGPSWLGPLCTGAQPPGTPPSLGATATVTTTHELRTRRPTGPLLLRRHLWRQPGRCRLLHRDRSHAPRVSSSRHCALRADRPTTLWRAAPGPLSLGTAVLSSLVLLGDSEGTLFTGCVPNGSLRFPPNNLFSGGDVYFQSTEAPNRALWEFVGIFFYTLVSPAFH